MNREQLAELIDDQFSANVFDYSFIAKGALANALWLVLAEVWRQGRDDALTLGSLAPNPYEDELWQPDPLDKLCTCSHRRGDHDGPCVHECPCMQYKEATTEKPPDAPIMYEWIRSDGTVLQRDFIPEYLDGVPSFLLGADGVVLLWRQDVEGNRDAVAAVRDGKPMDLAEALDVPV